MVKLSFLNKPPGVQCSQKIEDIIWAKGNTCGRESGFTWAIIQAPPDANQITSMCQSATCVLMFDSFKATSPSECVTKSGWYLYADLVNPTLKGCESVPKPVTTGEAPYNGTGSTTAKPTTAPTTTSPPTTTVPASSSTSTTSAPSPFTATPVTVAPPTAAALATSAPAIATAAPVADANAQVISSAMSRGTIIAIISASVVVFTTIVGLIKFLYARRQNKKQHA